MKTTGTFEFLGIDTFNGKENKVYKNAVLMQGTETVKIFMNDETEKMLSGIQRMEKIDCELDIRIGLKTFVNITAVKRLNIKVA